MAHRGDTLRLRAYDTISNVTHYYDTFNIVYNNYIIGQTINDTIYCNKYDTIAKSDMYWTVGHD
jgi:hypothetical protein